MGCGNSKEEVLQEDVVILGNGRFTSHLAALPLLLNTYNTVAAKELVLCTAHVPSEGYSSIVFAVTDRNANYFEKELFESELMETVCYLFTDNIILTTTFRQRS
jgi:hypothetical protein